LTRRILTRDSLLEELEAERTNVLTKQQIDQLSCSTKVAMVLSAPLAELANIHIEKTPEDTARIAYAIDLLHDLIRSSLVRMQIPFGKITPARIQKEGYFLILNAETERLPMMVDSALELGWPATNLILIDCGKTGVANTKTQFEILSKLPFTRNDYYKLRQLVTLSRILVVTTWYHVPRVRRTAAFTRRDTHYTLPVVGVPHNACIGFETDNRVEGEIERILSYTKKGWLRAFPFKQKFS
jgi:hypothetical protein